MPDNKENYINRPGVALGLPVTPIVPFPSIGSGENRDNDKSFSVNDYFQKELNQAKPGGVQDIPLSSFYIGNRYPETRPGTDFEEMYGQQQTTADKLANGTIKMLGTAAASLGSGTIGLVYGIGASVLEQRLASLIDNDVTRMLDDTSRQMEDALPNYYTKQEQDAEWYSTDNILTANFLSDKIIKNLGYSLGALGGGVAWSKAFKAIGLTNALVKAGAGLEAATAIEQTMSNVPRLEKYSAFETALNSVAQRYVKTPLSKVLNNSDRILTSAMGTFGEASIEGLQNMNEFRKKAIEEYVDKNGFAPEGEDLQRINEYADKVGMYTWGFNSMLLTATNYVQLPKILGSSRRADKAMINEIGQEVVGGDFTKTIAKTRFGKVVDGFRGVAPLFFSPAEAFEEGAQFAIQTGVNDYFKRGYDNKEATKSFLSSISGVSNNIFGEGIDRTLNTKEGLESILIGGLSGGMQQAGFVGSYVDEETGKTKFGFGKSGVLGEQGFFGLGGEKGKNTDIAIAALNKTKIAKVLEDGAKYVGIAMGSQNLRQQAIAINDKLSEKDYEADYTFSYLMPRVKYGKIESVMNEVGYYESQAMTDQGFAELQNKGIANQNETKEAFLSRLSVLKENAKSMDRMYSVIRDRYEDVVDENNVKKYDEEDLDKLVYASSKIRDYDNRLPGINQNLIEAGVITQPILDSIVGNNEPAVLATEEALNQINSLDLLQDDKDALKDNLKDLIEVALRRKLFINDYNGIVKNPGVYREIEKDIEPDEAILVKQQVVPEGKKRKKTIEKELELDKEYSLKQFVKLEDGKLKLSPRLTVVSKTLGGEYEVKFPSGRTTFLKPEEFKKYDILDQDVDSKEVERIIDEAIDTVLAKKKYKDVAKPTDNKLAYINSLDNQELINEVEKEITKRSQEFIDNLIKEEELLKQGDLKKELEGTGDNGVQTRRTGEGVYEPDSKKTDQEVVDSTKPPVEGYSQLEPLAEHHIRANRFGANYYKFDNRDNFRGIIVTQGNEAKIGLPGLMQFLKDKGKADASVDPSKTIALVVMGIDPVTNERYFVGVNGEKLENPTLENTIYQVFPENLEWSGGGSMFRDTTPETVKKSLTENYGKWRESTLKDPTVDLYKIQASFGIPQYVGELDEKGNFKFDYTATVPVEKSGLVTDVDLRTRRVVNIPTTDGAVVYGSSTFNDAKGVPLLYTDNGLVRLNNRQINKNEASLIYDAIVKLADNLFKDGNLKSNESVTIYNWLKSVIYWGTPQDAQGNRKPAGYSSVFFENMELIMGKEEKKFSLKPRDLKKNKAAIIEELQKMYNNVNSTLVTGGQKNEWNKPYKEIIAITPEGVQTREWKNYQTFLLSSKNPDGSARNEKTIPLTTRIRPLKNAEDTNRKGIYFTVIDKKSNTSQEPKAPVKKEVKGFVLDGETENTLSTKLGDIPFVANREKFEESGGKQGISLPDPETTPTYKAVLDGAIVLLSANPKSGITEDTSDEDAAKIVENIFRKLIADEIKKQLASATLKEETKPAEEAKAKPEVKPTVAPSLQQKINQRKQAGSTKRGSDFRMMLAKDLKKFKPENWNDVEKFLKATFPNIPVYRVKNYIVAANGRRAHGMFQDGAIYLSESAEVGTIYHEVFHAIWQALTDPAERANIANEFRSREGMFFDRATLSNVKYSEATDKQMEEKLAEELRDYFQEGKVPQKPAQVKQSWIAKLFSDIAEFFKTFFTGKDAKSNTEKLFEKIGSGYFKQATPYDSPLSFAKKGFIDIEDVVGGELADYSLDVFTGEQVHDIMQHMTYITVRDLFEENEGLFEITKEKKSERFKKLQDELGDLMAENIAEVEKMVDDEETTRAEADLIIDHYNNLYENIMNEWEGLTEKFEEYLKTYSIEFDENDELELTNDEKGKDNPFGDARKIDNMRKTNAAVKLLLASLPVVDSNGTEKLSSIGGYTLLPMSEIFIGTMNNVHNSRSMTEMLNRIKAMAADDPKYRKLYNRLSKLKNINELNDEHDLQLLSAFWRSFKKQSPDVKTVYILETGDIQVGDANFTTAARQVKEEFINSIKEAISKGSKYFKKAENGKSYVGNAEAIKGDIKLGKDDLEKQVAFLKELGIEFDLEKLSVIPERTKFAESVNGIRTSISNGKSIVSVGGRSLDIDKRLRDLSEIKAKMDNPEFSSTYYNVNGELTQTFIGTNAASDLYDMLSQIKNLNELEGTQYSYLLTDSFVKNSVLLYKMFDKETGIRIEGTENLMKTSYADGTVDTKKGRQKESSKLNYKERLVQEINLNLAGYYLNLIPGDASIGWAQYMGNAVDKSEILDNYKVVHDIFRGYLEDEITLAKEDRPVAKKRNSEELRFFKSILGEELQNDILAEENIEDVYKNHGEKINDAIDAFINKERDRLKTLLIEYGSLTMDENKYKTKELAFGRDGMTEEELNLELATLSINFAINNIELHKLLYSDPYQYSDELKRIKSFSSPRQSIVNSSQEMNTAYNKVWNKSFKEGELGYTDFEKDYFRAATIADADATSDLKDYGVFEETDGGGIISLKALRNFKIRAGEWDSDQEKQYKYDIVWEKKDKGGKLTNAEKKIYNAGNPGVKRTYTPIKPIVSGNKANDRPYNDVVLDKFALYPFSYRILREINPTSNAVKLYNKMQAEDVDYVVFKSGRKVGAENVFPLYKDGKFNEASFVSESEIENPLGPQTVLNIPFAIMSIQSEVPSKDDGAVTRGSQMTKLATLDFMQAGIPIDFQRDVKDFEKKYTAWNSLSEEEKLKSSELYKEIKNNQTILEALIEEGINELTGEFGLTKTPEGYKIEDIEKVADALKREITKREVNDNISAALKGYKNGDTFLEATPAYQQIRNILYSIADRTVMSPKMSGGMKVQIPSTLLESGDRIVAKNGALTSDILKFYEDKDGKRVCEIMVGRWFDSDMTDDELLTYLNETEEGQTILKGVAYRIPTQKQNSIDVFKIKKFLPKEFGDSVVIPSALVKKVGSDFDIDKLNIYFKNVDDTGARPVLIPFYGTSEEVRKGFRYRKDFKKSLENGYIESLEKLISHPLNFENLIKPNSADQLKGLSKQIVNKLGLGTFDYNDPGNMLSRRFMSRLRHAFVTGKYAIGIAAVNQTNHSLNQRQPVYIDMDRANLSVQDRKWLGDGEIKFREYNTINIDGVERPTISMITNKAGDFISDILGQMIDGYVDISKDTWIIEMGITPNVASTWMLLTKLGVPIDTVAYFMNQPIIREYLRELEKKGSTWLFDAKLVKSIEMRYKGSANIRITEIPSNTDLLDMIGKKSLSAVEKTEQKYMLREFLKYAKMGQQLFLVTQGTNFDTSTFNDPFLLFKKLNSLDKARDTIFSAKVGNEEMSAADALLKESFLGKLKDGIIDVREAISEILRMDKGGVRDLLQDVLSPYLDQNDRDFIRTSQRAVTTLIDWAVQTEKNLNTKIEDFLISKEKNVAKRITDFINTIKEDNPLYNNHVIKTLRPNFADPLKSGEVNNLYMKNKTNKLYDQNQLIYGFKELKNYLKSQNNIELYNDLVTLSILQSGLSQSTVSFTSLLPYDDVKETYNDVIGTLAQSSNLQSFNDLNVFERTFWNYDDVVPHMEAQYKVDWMSGFVTYNENMKFRPDIYNAMKSKELPILLRISQNSKEANSDVIVYTYEKEIKSSEKRKMREAGDYSYIKKGLFKKVGLVGNNYIYKAINAWGDGIYAKEFYNIPQESKIDNGFIKADETITDEKIMSYFGVTLEEPILEEDLPSEEDVITETPTPTAPVEVGGEKLVDPASYTKETKDIIFKSNLEENEYKVIELNGTQRVIDIRQIPKKINKNSTKFYSIISSGMFVERYGKKFVIPGFEDINLMIEQGSNIVIELSTGQGVGDTVARNQKDIKEELASKFEKKNVREVLARTKKIDMNNALISITYPTFEESFSADRQKEIVTNFAAKHKLSEKEAKAYIDNAIATKGQQVIDKLNECY